MIRVEQMRLGVDDVKMFIVVAPPRRSGKDLPSVRDGRGFDAVQVSDWHYWRGRDKAQLVVQVIDLHCPHRNETPLQQRTNAIFGLGPRRRESARRDANRSR